MQTLNIIIFVSNENIKILQTKVKQQSFPTSFSHGLGRYKNNILCAAEINRSIFFRKKKENYEPIYFPMINE